MTNSNYHSAHFKIDPTRAVLWKVLSKYLLKYFPNNSNVLEIGAGYCYWINSISAQKKVAIDIWPDMVNYAASDVEPIIYDLSKGLPKVDGLRFDNILASNLMEHFLPDDGLKLVGDIFENLKPGGRLILIQPNFRFAYKSYFDDYTHRAIYTDVSLPNLLRSQGFEIEKVVPKFTPYSMIGMKFKVPSWVISAYLRSPIKPFAGQMLVIGKKPLL